MTIGIISEGVSDFYTLRSILRSFTEDKELPLNQLQPRTDAEPGGWDKVLKYCRSEEFKQALAFNDFLIVQIDTDFLRTDSVSEQYRVPDIEKLTPAEIMAKMAAFLIDTIGRDFYLKHQAEIIFAIAVDQIECWFLGIYYPGNEAKRSKIKNCLKTLESELQKKHGFTIDKKEKKYYEEICAAFKKKRNLLALSQYNDSFSAFMEELERKIAVH